MGTLLFSKQINPHLTLGVEDTANVVLIVPTVEGSKQRTITVTHIEGMIEHLRGARTVAFMVERDGEYIAGAYAKDAGWTVL
jgi:hypothetical protein